MEEIHLVITCGTRKQRLFESLSQGTDGLGTQSVSSWGLWWCLKARKAL